MKLLISEPHLGFAFEGDGLCDVDDAVRYTLPQTGGGAAMGCGEKLGGEGVVKIPEFSSVSLNVVWKPCCTVMHPVV